MTQQTVSSHSEFLRKPDVKRRVGLSDATIWRLQKRGEFPRSFAISRGLVAWLAVDIDNWMAERVADGRSIQYRGAVRIK